MESNLSRPGGLVQRVWKLPDRVSDLGRVHTPEPQQRKSERHFIAVIIVNQFISLCKDLPILIGTGLGWGPDSGV